MRCPGNNPDNAISDRDFVSRRSFAERFRNLVTLSIIDQYNVVFDLSSAVRFFPFCPVISASRAVVCTLELRETAIVPVESIVLRPRHDKV